MPSLLVLVFHGAGGDSEKAAQQTRWCEVAERENFIVCFPNGLPVDTTRPTSFLRNPQVWNSGVERGLAYVPKVDDVGYIDALISNLVELHQINKSKIFATGFSNGGGMCWRLALQLSNRFAAIAPVCSYVSVTEPWIQQKSVSAVAINCLEDPFIPLEGGLVKDIWSRVEIMRPSVVDAIAKYAFLSGCEFDKVESLSDDVTKISYRSAASRMPHIMVDFYKVANAGHAYPGGPPLLSERIAGKPTDALDATAVIWRFFQAVMGETPYEVGSTPDQPDPEGSP